MGEVARGIARASIVGEVGGPDLMKVNEHVPFRAEGLMVFIVDIVECKLEVCSLHKVSVKVRRMTSKDL